ncbi:MAG: 7,8-didemethyl-8-hydroxy-5-deazariboflavin synthase subunit CofG, partial [Euryarchaeota archaeon]|nr:7,8-didemethyl-8-hydroxy-5-deazariboflavin synthase subunit CofG [Euryarchaeota archaeon]
MEDAVRGMGYVPRERLCIYPGYIRKGWYPERMGDLIKAYADGDGLVKEGP